MPQDSLESLMDAVRIYNSFFVLLIAAIFVASVALLVVLARNAKARKNLKRNTSFLAETIWAQEEERRRISQELHDTVSQNIKALLLLQKECLEAAQGQADKERIKKIIELEKLNQSQLRAIIQNLALPAPSGVPFKNILMDLCEQFSKQSAIECKFFCADQVDLERFSAQARRHIMRIIQEALNNAKTHAQAQETGVVIQKREGKIRIMIFDDGIGIDLDSNSGSLPYQKGQTHFGMTGMEMRAALLGGSLSVRSSKDTGTEICLELPWGEDL
ncbi:MAG: sensor histidine kinase [Treponema sp.]|nr:sensor histidine kinase [Treponema sp.]